MGIQRTAVPLKNSLGYSHSEKVVSDADAERRLAKSFVSCDAAGRVWLKGFQGVCHTDIDKARSGY